MADKPAWLKKMEHGAIGEARAKAFLLDRFWVLERSVDIDGADYLIQRQITRNNFLDREPPRLGIVQVKFIQDEATSIYISKDYVVGELGLPHGEFFVLVLSGKEDDESSFLLSAQDVAQCPLRKDDQGSYRVSGKMLLTEGRFKITSKQRALDRIEHALKNADFVRNRRFISSSSYLKLSPDQIEHDFLIPLDNAYADIPTAFFELKEKLQSTLFEIEDITGAMHEILRSTDPEAAYRIFEDKISDYIRNVGHTNISVTCEAFDDEDFLTAVKNHKGRLVKLRELNCSEAYFDLLKLIGKEIVRQVSALGVIGKTDYVKVTVEYDKRRLGNAAVKVKGSSKKPSSSADVLESAPGRHVLLFKPWDWLPYEVRANKQSPPSGEDAIAETIAKVPWYFTRPIQREIDLHLLGKDLVDPFR